MRETRNECKEESRKEQIRNSKGRECQMKTRKEEASDMSEHYTRLGWPVQSDKANYKHLCLLQGCHKTHYFSTVDAKMIKTWQYSFFYCTAGQGSRLTASRRNGYLGDTVKLLLERPWTHPIIFTLIMLHCKQHIHVEISRRRASNVSCWQSCWAK